MGGALGARGIPTGDGRLRSEVTGEIEVEDGVLVIKRIHVRYELTVDADADRARIDRAHDHHAAHCPVARSIDGCIDITTEIHLTDA